MTPTMKSSAWWGVLVDHGTRGDARKTTIDCRVQRSKYLTWILPRFLESIHGRALLVASLSRTGSLRRRLEMERHKLQMQNPPFLARKNLLLLHREFLDKKLENSCASYLGVSPKHDFSLLRWPSGAGKGNLLVHSLATQLTHDKQSENTCCWHLDCMTISPAWAILDYSAKAV